MREHDEGSDGIRWCQLEVAVGSAAGMKACAYRPQYVAPAGWILA